MLTEVPFMVLNIFEHIKMGAWAVIATMLVIIALTWIIARKDARTAYRLFETSQCLFEPDDEVSRAAGLAKHTKPAFGTRRSGTRD